MTMMEKELKYRFSENFSLRANIHEAIFYTTDLFIQLFNNMYLRNFDSLHIRNSRMSLSNFTRVSSATALSTSQLLDCKIEFECENRHDAIVRFNNNEIALCVEWEVFERSVFNDKGEVGKIFNTCKIKHCDGFLFTYNYQMDTSNFFEMIFDEWNKRSSDQDNFVLYVSTLLIEKTMTSMHLKGIRTAVISHKNIELWNDLELTGIKE